MSTAPATGTVPEPRWPAALAVASVALLNMILPEPLSAGPFWLLMVVVAILFIPLVVTHRLGHHHLNQRFAYVLLGTVTGFLVYSVWRLVLAMTQHRESPSQLLLAAAVLWLSNILVFASWYWRLDGGGPHCRFVRPGHTHGAFLFPQMTMDEAERRHAGFGNWRPGFVDYLFLAFNTSTAFSPTDVPVLSRWAKVMMMVQSVISLLTIALLAARAVNIL
ncbi:MAG TPA: hypothetical protein VMJ34_11645 [Bryobacteraceae bacterium]|nr:hypothetical protein [Bryobacteraceae bacterium]